MKRVVWFISWSDETMTFFQRIITSFKCRTKTEIGTKMPRIEKRLRNTTASFINFSNKSSMPGSQSLTPAATSSCTSSSVYFCLFRHHLHRSRPGSHPLRSNFRLSLRPLRQCLHAKQLKCRYFSRQFPVQGDIHPVKHSHCTHLRVLRVQGLLSKPQEIPQVFQ